MDGAPRRRAGEHASDRTPAAGAEHDQPGVLRARRGCSGHGPGSSTGSRLAVRGMKSPSRFCASASACSAISRVGQASLLEGVDGAEHDRRPGEHGQCASEGDRLQPGGRAVDPHEDWVRVIGHDAERSSVLGSAHPQSGECRARSFPRRFAARARCRRPVGRATIVARCRSLAPASPTRRNVLEIADLDAPEFDALLDLASTMKRHPTAWRHSLEGRTIACVLHAPLVRGPHRHRRPPINRLGALPADAHARCAPGRRRAHALERVRRDRHPRRAAPRPQQTSPRTPPCPVVNAYSREHDPCEALAHCLALRERFGSLDGLSIAYVGPAGGLAHSLLQAAPIARFELRLACPPTAMADPWLLACAGQAGAHLRRPGRSRSRSARRAARAKRRPRPHSHHTGAAARADHRRLGGLADAHHHHPDPAGRARRPRGLPARSRPRRGARDAHLVGLPGRRQGVQGQEAGQVPVPGLQLGSPGAGSSATRRSSSAGASRRACTTAWWPSRPRPDGGLKIAPEYDPRAIDYAVVMRRYDEADTLASQLHQRAAGELLVMTVGAAVAAFHNEAPVVEGADPTALERRRRGDAHQPGRRRSARTAARVAGPLLPRRAPGLRPAAGRTRGGGPRP